MRQVQLSIPIFILLYLNNKIDENSQENEQLKEKIQVLKKKINGYEKDLATRLFFISMLVPYGTKYWHRELQPACERTIGYYCEWKRYPDPTHYDFTTGRLCKPCKGIDGI